MGPEPSTWAVSEPVSNRQYNTVVKPSHDAETDTLTVLLRDVRVHTNEDNGDPGREAALPITTQMAS